MKDSYTVALVFDNKPRYVAFGGNNQILPKGLKITTNRNNGAKFTKNEAEKIRNLVKTHKLGEKQIRIESTLFESEV